MIRKGAALAGVAMWAFLPVAADAAPLALRYDAFVLGFPAVVFEFQLDQREADYHVSGSAQTVGMAKLVVDYHLETKTEGRVVGGKLQPTGETSQSRRNGVERLMRLDYEGARVEAQVTPPPAKTLAPDEIAGTLDPTSAALAAGRVLAASGRCDQRIKVFDGHTRYDLVLTDEGEARLDQTLGVYKGIAHRCRLALVKLNEAQLKLNETQREEADTRSEPAEVWFASIDPSLPPVPVQIDFSSHWGAAAIALTWVGPVAAVAGTRP